jgi:glycosyltransferase involved in cell wall biosynthesis
MLVKELIKRKSRWAKSAWIKTIERRNLEQAAAIHVTSKFEKYECLKFGFKLPIISIVPNGIDPTKFSSDLLEPSDWIRPLLDKQPMILFLSRISWKKGIDRLIPALAHVPDAHLIIAGNDDENYTPYLTSLAKQHGVERRINFPGPVRNGDKKALLKAAKVLTLPSYSENFGNVVLEAMAVGCPVIVTPEVGLSDTVLETGSGIVTDGSPDKLGPEIKRLLEDDKQRQKMGKSGLRAVREIFGWPTVSEKMEGVYRFVLSKNDKKALGITST